ncbi:unnamed protein product, partial [Didymodactylos carnosus]
ANKKQCERLSKRIDAITAPLESLTTNDVYSHPKYSETLTNLFECIQQCQQFIEKFCDEKNWIIRVIKKDSNQENFQELNQLLLQYSTDLQLNINLSFIFDREQDTKDLKFDHQDLIERYDQIFDMYRELVSKHGEILERLDDLKYDYKHKLLKTELDINMKLIPLDAIALDKIISHGKFSIVHHGHWRENDIAVKFIHPDLTLNESMRKEILNEITIMYKLGGFKHIVNILGACMENGRYGIVQEYMSAGSLYDVLKQRKLITTWSQRYSIALQMSKAINYLHMEKPQILHCNIKSANFLLD